MEGGKAEQELQAGREVLQYADGGAAALGCGLGATKVRILPKAACTWKTVSAGCFLKRIQRSKAACTHVCSFSKDAGCLRGDNIVRTNSYPAILPPQNGFSACFMFLATALFLWLWREVFKLIVSFGRQKGRLKFQTAFVHPTNPSIPAA